MTSHVHTRRRRSGRTRIPIRKKRRRPVIEMLEERTLLATIVVNNLTDTPEIGKTTPRQAIDVFASGDTITFDSSIFAIPRRSASIRPREA